MSTGAGDGPRLTGSLYTLPFEARSFRETALEQFRDFLSEHDPTDILVLKRFPSGTDDLRQSLGSEVDGVSRPRVLGLSQHAHRVLETLPTEYRLLDYSEQRILLREFIEATEWEAEYLRRSAAKAGFVDDVARFISEATWQGRAIETEDPVLAELAECKRAYHDWLEANDYRDPANAIPAASDALAEPEKRDLIQQSIDAVLVLEFEEFTAIDRAYLANLCDGLPLVCLAQADSAIQRTWNEPRSIEHYTPGLAAVDIPDTDDIDSGPERVANLLATGDVASSLEGSTGEVGVIEAQTFDEQIGKVADEIERLRKEEDLRYEECAVVLRDSNAPIPETVRHLRTSGIPVQSATVGGLEHDPAARELYALVSWCTQTSEVKSDGLGWDSDRARSVLTSRVPSATDALLQDVQQIGVESGIRPALDRWVLETDLKARIADHQSALDASTQFDHVEEIRSLAEFLDGTPLLEATWPTFCESLEREMQRASSDRIATDLETGEEGVLVDAARIVKHTSRSTVFLVNVVDRDYPAEPHFTPLFPTPHIEQLEAYPAFTTPTADDVRSTFQTAGELSARPLMAYYAELSRRILAIGARTASERLYFTTYREDTGGTGSNLQPSRYLAEIEAELGELPRIEHDGLYSHGSAIERALSQVDETLQAVRRAGVMGEPIDLDDLASEFATVQLILDADRPEDLRRAVRSRVDFARGVVRRE